MKLIKKPIIMLAFILILIAFLTAAFRYLYKDKREPVQAGSVDVQSTAAVPAATAVFRDLTVLEVQPYAQFKTDAQWNTLIQQIIPGFNGQLHVVRMISSEFIGKKEDLNAVYDFLYFGLNKNSGATYTFAFAKDGSSIYQHMGELQSYSTARLRLDVNHDGKTRYSGNDITKVKMNEILDFVSAGYPVILDKGFHTGGKGAANEGVNTTNVDRASYMYELLNTLMKKPTYQDNYKNLVFYEGEMNSSAKQELSELLAKERCQLILSKTPVLYKDITLPENAGLTAKDVYINGTDITNCTMKFKLEVKDRDDCEYKLAIYADMNSDGHFNENVESLDGLEITDSQGKRVSGTVIRSNEAYTVERRIDNYIGVLPWKTEVVRTDNASIRASEMGFSAIQANNNAAGYEKEKLYILQIVPDNSNSGLNAVLPTAADIARMKARDINATSFITGDLIVTNFDDSEYVVNNQNVLKNATYFYNYTSKLNDFEVRFDRKTVAQINSMSSNAKLFEAYDMLIIGFQDSFTDADNETKNLNLNSIQLIQSYIGEGKAVLFTHDTTTRQSEAVPSMEFRDLQGMDRFGVTANGEYSKENKDKPYALGTLQSANTYDKYIQGFSNFNIWREKESGNGEMPTTTKVTQVNKGQITEYPYTISEELPVAETHMQWFQLDFESNDVVVWYCLAGNAYGQLPNDARNNYYIYNRGNVTYSGVGHSNGMSEMEVKLFVNTIVAAYRAAAAPLGVEINNHDKSGKGSQVSLYINYDAFSDAGTAIGSEIYMGSDYVTGSEKVSDGYGSNDGQYKKILFTVQERSVLTNKKIFVQYFLKTEKGYVEMTGLKTRMDSTSAAVNHMAITESVSAVIDGKTESGSKVAAGGNYYVLVPIDRLKDKNSMEVMIKLTMTYGKNSKFAYQAEQKLTIYRRGMFQLY